MFIYINIYKYISFQTKLDLLRMIQKNEATIQKNEATVDISPIWIESITSLGFKDNILKLRSKDSQDKIFFKKYVFISLKETDSLSFKAINMKDWLYVNYQCISFFHNFLPIFEWIKNPTIFFALIFVYIEVHCPLKYRLLLFHSRSFWRKFHSIFQIKSLTQKNEATVSEIWIGATYCSN